MSRYVGVWVAVSVSSKPSNIVIDVCGYCGLMEFFCSQSGVSKLFSSLTPS